MTTSTAPYDALDVLVIGAGQAGLALGYHLQRAGLRFTLLDAAPRVGESWRTRWDSLRLFTPAEFCSLPGMRFPAPAGTYPSKDDVAGYLERYVRTFELPVQLGTSVRRVTRESDGTFCATAGDRSFRARHVTVATGPFQEPLIPGVATGLSPRSGSCTAPTTDVPRTCRPGGSSSWAPATPDCRSPTSSPPRVVR
jgi:putative flavoprotein involved in K+ transport